MPATTICKDAATGIGQFVKRPKLECATMKGGVLDMNK